MKYSSLILDIVRQALMSTIIIVLFFYLLAAVPINITGLLIGFQNSSEACSNYRHHRQTRLSFIVAPITGYACQENGGLLQPALSDFAKWLTEVPE